MNVKDERAAALARLPKLLTAEFLDRLTTAVVAYDVGGALEGAEAIAFVIWCHEIAGRTPPDFDRFSE